MIPGHAFLRSVLLGALALAAGCDRFRDESHGPPRILRAMAYDATAHFPPVATEEDPDPSDMRLTAVPLSFARFRIEFDKALDGATIQTNPGADLCVPSPNITFSPTEAAVCYDPGGANPSITVSPATLTCSGGAALPRPEGTLESGRTYVVAGTGIRDQDGHALDFKLTVEAATFVPTQVLAEMAYDSSGAVAETSDLATGPSGVPPGVPDPATGLFTIPTYAHAATDSGSLFYGTGFSVLFPSVMPGPGSEGDAGIDLQGALMLGGQPADVGLVSDGVSLDRLHLVPRLPLEDGATYRLQVTPAASGDIADALGNTTRVGLGPFVFGTPPAAQRVSWQYPLDGGSDLYPVLDEALQNTWSGQPFVGIATGTPYASATAVLTGPGGAPVPGVSGAPYARDARHRTVSLTSTSADRLVLANGTTYTMSWTVDGNVTGSSSFTTAAFANDARWPGFANEVKRFSSASDGHGPITAAQAGIPVASHGLAVPYFVTVTGRVDHVDDPAQARVYENPAIAGRAASYAFFPLAAGTDVKLYKGRFDPAGANSEVPLAAGGAMKGYARTFLTGATGLDPWTDGVYPGSLVGAVPRDPLEFGQPYTLVADVRSPGGDAVHVELPFTTVTFQVLGLDPPPDPQTPWSSANPFVLETSGVLDPAALATPSGLDGPVQVFGGGVQIAVAASTPAAGEPGANQWIRVVPKDDADVAFATTYAVLATAALESRGARLQTFSATFTTPPRTGPQGSLVCQ